MTTTIGGLWRRWWTGTAAHWTRDGVPVCHCPFRHGPTDEVVQLTSSGQPYGKTCARCAKLQASPLARTRRG